MKKGLKLFEKFKKKVNIFNRFFKAVNFNFPIVFIDFDIKPYIRVAFIYKYDYSIKENILFRGKLI